MTTMDHAALPECLRRSLRSARARWVRAFPGAIPERDLDQAVESLGLALGERMGIAAPVHVSGEDPFRDDPSPPDLSLGVRPELHGIRRTLVGFARRTFLDETDLDPDARLRALAHLQDLEEELEPDWEHQLQAGLMGPAAMDLLAEIGHDLRSPLTSVLFLSEALRSGQSGPISDVQGRQLALIYSAGMTLLTVVNNFVELSREGPGAGSPELAPTGLNEVLSSLRDSVHPMAEDKEILLEVDFLKAPDRIETHAVSLYRILLNLVTNGIRHSSEGDSVRVGVHRGPRGWMTFQVQDTGPGIPDDRKASLMRTFEPSADRRGIRFSGTGLGLVIARKLLQRIGGSELEVESTLGEGTTFRFRLPSDTPPAP